MATVYEIPIIDAPFQRLQTVLNGKAVTILLSYSARANRWSLGLERGDETILAGRRLVPGVDLLKLFNFGLGKLALLQAVAGDAEPGRSELPAGIFRLYSLSEA